MSISSTLPSVQPVHGEWAQRITAAWQKTVEGVIETGTLLVQAKRWMSPNEFTDMIEHELPFTRHTAQRLIKIAHQGSPPGLSDDLVTPGWAKRASEPPSVCRVSGVQTRSRCDRDPTWRCHWCGRRCSPFVRYEFLRGRTCSIRRQTSARRRP